MLIAFKTHASNPDKPVGMPNDNPWFVEHIEDELEETYRNQFYSVMNQADYDAYVLNQAAAVQIYLDNIEGKRLRVRDLLSKEFKAYAAPKIDFTIHLEKNILLVKKVIMAANGRPIKAKYYYPDKSKEDNLVAEINFEFVDNASKFMVERKEWLGYYQKDGTIPEQFMIHHRAYDFTDLKEASESLAERVEARTNIIAELKIVIQTLLITNAMQAGHSAGEAAMISITEGTIFFNDYKDSIRNFIEVASSEFKTGIYSDTTYAFLNQYIKPNVTCRQYIFDRLTY